MVTAMVLINAERSKVNETAQELVELEGVAEVYSVAGPYDLVAMVRVETNEEMASVVTGSMLKLEGIEDTTTLIAFRTYSEYDLERVFSIGMDEEL